MKNKMVCCMVVCMMMFSFISCGDAKKTESTSVEYSSVENREEDFVYTELSDGTIGIRGYDREKESVVIPANYDGKTVSAVGCMDHENDIEDGGLMNYSNLKSVVITDGVKYIYKRSFANCGIETLDLGNTIEFIGESAFLQSKLTEVTIPASVKEIRKQAFSLNPLEKVVFEGDVQEIEDGAFLGASENLTIYGPAGSNVEAFANKNGYQFIAQ